jgi:2-dehydropantoate 2-reductase
VLILTSKSQHGPAIVGEVAELPVGRSTAGRSVPLFCAQNGVANERRALRRFRSVYGVCVVCPSVFLEPGRVDSYTVPRSGILDLGRYPDGLDGRAEQVAAAFAGSGFYATGRPSIMPWKYAKLLDNLGNAIEALAGRDLDDDAEQVAAELRRRARAEGVACLRAARIEVLDADRWRAHRDRVRDRTVEGRRRGGGSSWQSVARRTGSVEADYLNGEIVMLGRLHGVPTPVNEALQREIIVMARDGLAPGSVPLRYFLPAS